MCGCIPTKPPLSFTAELRPASNRLACVLFSVSQFLRNNMIMAGIILLGSELEAMLVTLAHRLVHWRGQE